MMFDRIGDEGARATSLVRYAPNSVFPPHVHGGGEEFFVLEGEFADEHRTYPVGSYVRNPIGTKHAPRVGPAGCVLFVKLWQFEADDAAQIVIDTRKAEFSVNFAPGIDGMPLHRFGDEHVFLLRWAPNVHYKPHSHHGGEEVFVVEGSYVDDFGEYPAGSWVRYPDGSEHAARTTDEGALLYLKAGHLPPPADGAQ